MRILARLVDSDRPELRTKRLCAVCVEVTEMSGAGIMLMGDHMPRGSVCTTDPVSALIEELQFALGEGPCVDAFHHERPILEPDLAVPTVPRWPAFTGPAVDAGARAVFGFPLQIGAARLGALNLYRDRPGRIGDEQYADALVMADVAARAVLALQAGAPPGQLAEELGARADFHSGVHQAAGMVAAQLDTNVAQALIRLRAYAFGNDRPLAEVAKAVVGRALRFEPGDDENESTP